jgi:hypothetical protein
MNPQAAAAQRGRALWWLLLAGALMALAVRWWVVQHAAIEPQVQLAALQPSTANPAATPLVRPVAASAPAGTPLSAAGLAERREQLALWQGRLERAQDALAAYRAAAQYPHESRPIEEHPDQVRPFAPIEEERSLRMPGGTAPQGVKLRTTQERVFASGSESSRVTLRLEDLQGRPLPLRATRAVMKEVTPPGATASTAEFAMPLQTTPDGTLVAVMRPAAQGFAGFAGTVRLELLLDHAGQPGFIYFDLVYSPQTAALWLPGLRDAVENGSLVFHARLQVLLPGRYVVSARIDDAGGQPLALALFNRELPAGTHEIALPVFGKLIRDKAPPLPLQLRDMEGFLLRENTFPDRVMLPRLTGVLHRSAVHPLAAFSAAEWQSEERERYLTELNKDVDTARRKVEQLGP